LHGKSVLPGVTTLVRAGSWIRVLGHAQIVEDSADTTGELVDGGDDTIGALGLDETGGKAAQPCDVLRAVAGADGAAVLAPVPIEHVVMGFDAPMVAVEC